MAERKLTKRCQYLFLKKKVHGKNFIGREFGNWTVVKCSGNDENCNPFYQCSCKCGSIKDFNGYYLVRGRIPRCDCEIYIKKKIKKSQVIEWVRDYQKFIEWVKSSKVLE